MDRSIARRRRALKVLRQTFDLRIREARIGFSDVDELIVPANRKGHIGEYCPSFSMAVLRRGHDAIESGQRLLILEPRFAAPPRRIDGVRGFDHEPLVGARASGVEESIDIRAIARFRLNREANRIAPGADDVAQSPQTLAKGHFKEHLAIDEEDVERKEDNRCVTQQRLGHFSPSEARLDLRKREHAVAEGDDLTVEHDRMAERAGR